ncbi:hypothetical protein F8388_025172 [Cannabis sativa]|uniref:Uncharacterized protein n=1 Tax=Cannabis sativa TaxID=3483 RepID=A0A7J6FS39_CANSA|nr:hypothetical protein F8388_025172 [Cannabis sativa]
MGQALGGHMRRHRASINDNGSDGFSSLLIKAATAKEQEEEKKNSTPPLMVLKRSNSIRIKADSCLLDLNLTPLENDLKIFF